MRYKPGISVVTSVHNEEGHIADWLEKAAWADEIIVVDSGSTDRTGEIARQFSEQSPEKFKVFTTTNKLMLNINKNYAIEQATREWVLLLDGDEQASEALATEIQQVVTDPSCAYVAFWIPRRTFVMGRFIQAWYPGHQLRLFRNGKACYACKDIHEHLTVDGPIGYLKDEILHHTEDSVAERVNKSNHFSEHWAAEHYLRGYPFRTWELILRPTIHFIDMYLRRGFWRDGVFGFIMAVHAWYSVFLRYAKLWAAYQGTSEFNVPDTNTPTDY